MVVNSTLNWWLTAPGRLLTRWVAGYISAPESRPLPPTGDRLPPPPGLTLGKPVSGGLALDFYRRHRRLFGRTAVGASIFRFKYRGDLDSGWRLVLAAASLLRENGIADNVEVVIPTPSSPVFREYSPSLWLAQKLADALGKPVFTDTFKRLRLGLPQKEVSSMRAKRANIAGMYEVMESQKQVIEGRRVLLVDDIYDSGHTLAELQNLLQESGADYVIPFAFASNRRAGGQV